MDHHHQFQHTQTRKHQTKHINKRLSENQVRILESNFINSNKLDPNRKCQLAVDLGVPPRQVSIWYQNRRARDKTQSLELDHRALQLRLESVLAQNATLVGEIERLKDELAKIQGVFINSSSSTCDEVGSSNLVRCDKHDFEGGFYASFVKGGDAFVGARYDSFGQSSSMNRFVLKLNLGVSVSIIMVSIIMILVDRVLYIYIQLVHYVCNIIKLLFSFETNIIKLLYYV